MDKKPEVKAEISPLSPELYNKSQPEWAILGFMSQEDYEVHKRRMCDRKK